MASSDVEQRQGGTPSRQDAIVEAAIPVFLRFGYKKASMDAVAAAADLSRRLSISTSRTKRHSSAPS